MIQQDLEDLAEAFDAFRDILIARDYEGGTATEIAESALPFIADIIDVNRIGEDYS